MMAFEIENTEENSTAFEELETGHEELHVLTDDEVAKINPPSQPETTAVTTVVTKEHAHISDAFIARIRSILFREGLNIKNYGLKVSQGPWDTNDEYLELNIDENTVLSLRLARKSS